MNMGGITQGAHKSEKANPTEPCKYTVPFIILKSRDKHRQHYNTEDYSFNFIMFFPMNEEYQKA